MKKLLTPIIAVNALGAIGYVLLVAVWTFLIAIIFAFYVDSVITGQPMTIDHSPTPAHTSTGASIALVVAGYAVTALVILVSIGVMVLLPYVIGKWGSRLLRRGMLLIGVKGSGQSLYLSKACIVTTPLLVLLVMNFFFVPGDMAYPLVYMFMVLTAVIALVAFGLQHFLAKRLRVALQKVW